MQQKNIAAAAAATAVIIDNRYQMSLAMAGGCCPTIPFEDSNILLISETHQSSHKEVYQQW
jgi:hypothetical protein